MYDNLAIECLLTPNAYKPWKSYHGRQIIFASDASAPVGTEDGGEMNQTSRVLRCTKLLFSEISRSKAEVLAEKFQKKSLFGAMWKMADLINVYTILFSVLTKNSDEALASKISEINEMSNSKEILSLLHFGSTGNAEIRAFFDKYKGGPYPIEFPDFAEILTPASLDHILQFRTDLNSMSTSEIGIIENFGYLMASIRCHLYVSPFLRY
jgi:hypothetical protein